MEIKQPKYELNDKVWVREQESVGTREKCECCGHLLDYNTYRDFPLELTVNRITLHWNCAGHLLRYDLIDEKGQYYQEYEEYIFSTKEEVSKKIKEADGN